MIKLSDIAKSINEKHMWLKHELWEMYHKMKDDEILKRIDLLENLIKEQPKVSEWVPCCERLPKTNGVYQVTREIFEIKYPYRIATCAYFDGQDTWHSDNRVNHGREYLKDIVAWKPLDEPYKEEATK